MALRDLYKTRIDSRNARAEDLSREAVALIKSAETVSKAFLAKSIADSSADAPRLDFERRTGDIQKEEERLMRLEGTLRSDLDSLSNEYKLLQQKLARTEEMTKERSKENHGTDIITISTVISPTRPLFCTCGLMRDRDRDREFAEYFPLPQPSRLHQRSSRRSRRTHGRAGAPSQRSSTAGVSSETPTLICGGRETNSTRPRRS